ncbi:MAG: DUF1266 domain-containing protein [Campylobacteraceae bacterium]
MAKDYQTLLAEFQKKMAEMGANPDPREIYKLQQQMQEEMMNAVNSMSPEEMRAYSDSAYEHDDDDKLDDDEALSQFIAAHQQPRELEKYLAFGSFLVLVNYEPYQTLEMMSESKDMADTLASSWGVDDKESAKKTIERIFNIGHRTDFNKDYLAIKNGQTDGFDDDDLDNFINTYRALVEFYPNEKIDKCYSIIAWDIDRAAFLARAYASIGYISEKEAWEWLKKCAAEAKKHFNNWDDYAISLMMGRAVTLGFHPIYIDALNILRFEDKEFLDTKSFSEF